jgi:nucleoside-diphosphate-sugar epimerase
VLLRIATRRQDTVGVTFNAAGSSIVSLSEYLALLASILDKPLHIVQVHADSSEALFAEPGYPFYSPSNAFADIAKLENVLGFRPRGFEKFLPRIVQWYLEEYRGEVPEAYRSLRDREEKVLCGQ